MAPLLSLQSADANTEKFRMSRSSPMGLCYAIARVQAQCKPESSAEECAQIGPEGREASQFPFFSHIMYFAVES